MQKIVIDGGVSLKGEVNVSGAKNSALPLLMATILSEGENVLNNVPNVVDVRTTCKLLEGLGAHVEFSKGKARIANEDISCYEAPYELVKTMRASVLCLGPLLARYGKARVSLPGGCAIGARPIDQHLKGLEKMGAKVNLSHGYVEASARRLRGTVLLMDMVTVTGTENLMMAATLAKGITEIKNAAREPEVVQLARVLNRMGAKISGAGSNCISIQGVDDLRPMDATVVPDRIEAGTLMCAACITRGDVWIQKIIPAHLVAVTAKLREAGATVDEQQDRVRVRMKSRPAAVDLSTQPYPGFPTDMQAQFMALMSMAKGTSIIRERIFENRFMHVQELKRMGAKIKLDGGQATISGVSELMGAPLMATDLRASASLVLAGLVAKGRTEIHRVYHLDRGYQRLGKKLRGLGARIRRVSAQVPKTIK